MMNVVLYSNYHEQVYLTTAYFVDPNIICNGGRTQEDFDRDGTGNVLLIQTGQTPEHLYAAPLTASDANRVLFSS